MFYFLDSVLVLLLSICERCGVTLENSTIPLLLGNYNATLGARDVTVLRLLHLHDRHLTLSSFRPFFWSAKAREYFANMTSPSLWKSATADQVLELIDAERMLRTAFNFPLNLSLEV